MSLSDAVKHVFSAAWPSIALILSVCWLLSSLTLTPRLFSVDFRIPLVMSAIAITLLLATTPITDEDILPKVEIPVLTLKGKVKGYINKTLQPCYKTVMKLPAIVKAYTSKQQRRKLTNFAIGLLLLALGIFGLNYLVATTPMLIALVSWRREMIRRETLGFCHDRVREVSEEAQENALQKIYEEAERQRHQRDLPKPSSGVT